MKRGSLDEKLKYVNFIFNLGEIPIKPENTFKANFMYKNENLLTYSQQRGKFLDPITNTLEKASYYKSRSDMVNGAIIFIRLPDKFMTNLTMGDFLDELNKVSMGYMNRYFSVDVKFENDVVGPSYVNFPVIGGPSNRAIIRNRINNSFVLQGVRISYSDGFPVDQYNFFTNYFETKTLVEPTDLLEFDIKVNLDVLKDDFGRRRPPCGIYTGSQGLKALTPDDEAFYDASVERDGACMVLNNDTASLCPVPDDTRWRTNPSGKQYADVSCMYYVPDLTNLQEKVRLYKELPKPTNYYKRNFYAKAAIEKLMEEYCTKKGNRDDIVGIKGETCYELFPDVDYYTENAGAEKGCKTEDGNYIKYDNLETDELKDSCYPGGKPANSCYDATTADIPNSITKECYPICYSNGDKKDFKENKLGKHCYPFYLYNDVDCEPSEDVKVSGGLKYKYDHDKKCKVYTCTDGYINIDGKCKKDRTNIKLLFFGGIIALIIIFILIM